MTALMPCVCGRHFIPDADMYAAHVRTPEHQAWREREYGENCYVELRRVPPMFTCACGFIHWTDSHRGQKHLSMGYQTTAIGESA